MCFIYQSINIISYQCNLRIEAPVHISCRFIFLFKIFSSEIFNITFKISFLTISSMIPKLSKSSKVHFLHCFYTSNPRFVYTLMHRFSQSQPTANLFTIYDFFPFQVQLKKCLSQVFPRVVWFLVLVTFFIALLTSYIMDEVNFTVSLLPTPLN